MRRDDIRALVKSAGLRAAVETFRDLLEGVELDNGAKLPKLQPETVSIRTLWEGFVGPAEETLPSYMDELAALDLKEEVNSTGFVATSRMLINAMVIDAYNSIGGIGSQLVTNMPSNHRHEVIAGFTESEGLKEVKEGMDYEDSDIEEKFVTADAIKKGRLIYITEEAIMEDRTGQLLSRCRRIGQKAAIDKERTIINGVLDTTGRVYKPSGVPTALYSVANGNLVGDAATPDYNSLGFNTPIALEDWESIDLVKQFHPLSIKDDRAMGEKEPLLWTPKFVLVPPAKEATAKRIVNATEVRVTTNTNTRTIFNNPVAGLYSTLSSVYITNSADWYFGNFKEQFFWQDVWPIQTFSLGPNSNEAWRRDVVAGYKVRYLGGIFATDHRHVLKIKGA